ncbi:MAG: hypothetical protein KC417_12595, partial [Myxococcales bacterium]|nr:hypothetical protein [Myxococcales bacterium]
MPRRVNGWERWARVAVLVGFLGVEISACSLASEGTGAADAGGSTDGSADGGDASSACDEEASACVDGQLTVCAAGRWQASVTCPSGCAEDGSASCKAFVPSHVGSMDEVPMGPAVWNIESGTVTLNAETGEIKDGEDNVLRSVDDPDSDIGYSLVLQNSGPSLGVFVVRSLHVAAEATLRAEGSAAVVIVATERIEIDGTLDVSADGSDSGPGGGEHGNGADGVYSQIIGGYTHGAGGGGSNAGKGGQGGAHEAATGTGAGGLG